MGRKKLLEYVKLFDLTLLMESFLTQPKLSKAATDAAEKFIPKYIKDFCSCMKWEKGKDAFGKDSFIELFLLTASGCMAVQ